MTKVELDLIRTLGEFLPPDVIERWIMDEEKQKMQQKKTDNEDDS